CHMCEFPGSHTPVPVSILKKDYLQCHICKPRKTPSQLTIELWAPREVNTSCQKNCEEEQHRTMEQNSHLNKVAPHVHMKSS
ncbi:hypothetical protein GCK32_021903, partial [Trichostrongylus colubriformis]